MDILSPSLGAYFIGALPTEKLFSVRSKKKGKKNAIAARIAEHWLNDPRNKSIIWNLWCQLIRDGTAIGILTGTGSLSQVTSSKFSVKTATKLRRPQKTKRGENGQ